MHQKLAYIAVERILQQLLWLLSLIVEQQTNAYKINGNISIIHAQVGGFVVKK